jgi:hypothetical protein
VGGCALDLGVLCVWGVGVHFGPLEHSISMVCTLCDFGHLQFYFILCAGR